MGKIVKNIEELVGHTPLFEFVKYEENNKIVANSYGKQRKTHESKEFEEGYKKQGK